MKFTARTIDKATLPAGKSEAIFFDDSIPGFGLRIRDGGSRNWIFQYKVGKQHRRMTLGSASAIDAAKARSIAGDLHAKVRLGQDPAGVKTEARARAVESFAHARKLYLARRVRDMRPRSLEELTRHLESHCRKFAAMPLRSIERRHVAGLLAGIAETSGPVAANRTRASLSAFLNWACREGLIETNPATFTNRNAEAPRDRVLADGEIKAIWTASAGLEAPYRQFVQLLALTGQRRNEVAGARWSEIDLKAGIWTIPPSRTKNRVKHAVPLSPAALEVLRSLPRTDSDFVFTVTGRVAINSAAAIKQRLPELDQAWTFHDLRRTCSTVMAEKLGVLPHVIEGVLNHVSGHKAGVAGVYNLATYEREKRRALDLWADYVEGASNVIAMVR